MDGERERHENSQEPESHDSESESSDMGSERDTDVSDGWALHATTQQMRDQLDAVAVKHAKKGDQAFQSKQWQQAVHEYTSALKCVRDPAQEATLLGKRSEALCSMCQHIRSIPARTSERCALYGHDPTHLAQLALKDAQRAMQINPTCAELYAHQGSALLLLERYSDAESALLEGLALQPADKTLQAQLKHVQDMMSEQDREQQQLLAEVRRTAVAAAAAGGSSSDTAAAAAAAAAAGDDDTSNRVLIQGRAGSSSGAAEGSAAKRQRRHTLTGASADLDDCECILCLKLLYEPVTTPCGHTFCKGCFARSMDHGNRCPMCRTVLHVSRELPVTITLQNILSKAYPAEYAARAAEVAAAAGAAAAAAAAAEASTVTLPLFVMSTLLPGETMALNIFEPRYRLMVRRCMEGNRRFGMAQTGRTGPNGLDEIAVEAEITDCQLQPDGRYYLEMVGRRRIKITDSWDLDGYRVAAAQPMKDNAAAAAAAAAGDAEPSGSDNAAAAAVSVSELVDGLVETCDAVMDRLRTVLASRRVGPSQMRELFDRVGDRPPKSDPEAISWWASRLLLLIVPSNTESWLRRELMTLIDTAARLQLLQQKLDGRLEGAGIAACSIM